MEILYLSVIILQALVIFFIARMLIKVSKFAAVCAYKKGYYEETLRTSADKFSERDYANIKKVIDIQTVEKMNRHRNFEDD